jgi:hypothetical protein
MPCATPNCKGKVRSDNRYCWACERNVRLLMTQTGYLQNIDFIRLEERKRMANMVDGVFRVSKKQTRTRGEGVTARQITGEMMPSKKVK